MSRSHGTVGSMIGFVPRSPGRCEGGPDAVSQGCAYDIGVWFRHRLGTMVRFWMVPPNRSGVPWSPLRSSIPDIVGGRRQWSLEARSSTELSARPETIYGSTPAGCSLLACLKSPRKLCVGAGPPHVSYVVDTLVVLQPVSRDARGPWRTLLSRRSVRGLSVTGRRSTRCHHGTARRSQR